jgi:hypothetical protein
MPIPSTALMNLSGLLAAMLSALTPSALRPRSNGLLYMMLILIFADDIFT